MMNIHSIVLLALSIGPKSKLKKKIGVAGVSPH